MNASESCLFFNDRDDSELLNKSLNFLRHIVLKPGRAPVVTAGGTFGTSTDNKTTGVHIDSSNLSRCRRGVNLRLLTQQQQRFGVLSGGFKRINGDRPLIFVKMMVMVKTSVDNGGVFWHLNNIVKK